MVQAESIFANPAIENPVRFFAGAFAASHASVRTYKKPYFLLFVKREDIVAVGSLLYAERRFVFQGIFSVREA